MMPMSQIDMVVLLDGDKTLRVCGDFELESGRSQKPPEVHVLVQQGDIVAKGHKAVDDDLHSWTVEAATDQPQQFTAGPAIACAVVIVEKEPAGLEALSWVQEVNVLQRGATREENVPSHFRAPESGFSPKGGQLPRKHAVSSSLAILPTGNEAVSWRHKVEIRYVESAKVISPTAD